MLLDFIALLKVPGFLGALITGCIALALRYFQPASRIIWGTSHGFTFALPPPQAQQGVEQAGQRQENVPSVQNPLMVHTRTIFLVNRGRVSAENVEIILNFTPQHFSLWPQMNYTSAVNPENRFIIKLESLSVREYTSIELIQVGAELPQLLNVRSSNGISKEVTMAPLRTFPQWVNYLIVALILAGIYQFVVWLLLFVGYPHN